MLDPESKQLIIELMGQLQDKMEYGEDDFSERLGRKKPDLEVVKVEGDLGGDDMEGSDEPEMEADFDAPESPEEKLKSRLMKLRS